MTTRGLTQDDVYDNNKDIVCIRGESGKCYHKYKYIPNKYNPHTTRLATLCGADSAIYAMHLQRLDKVLNSGINFTPCKICYKEQESIQG